ncbi:MAG TPA: MFS transporter [Candidatus Limnocylindria bacterium]|nr:MFS transporter [Candidatus Limnocylindria bacterium]
MAERARGVFLVTLSTVSVGFLFADFAPLIPLLAPALGIAETQAGVFAVASGALYVAGTLATTGLPDRYGPKPVIAAGLAVGVLAVVVIAGAPTFGVALVGKGLAGIASSLTFVAGARYIAGLYGARRSHMALGFYGGGYPLGGAFALALMPRFAAATGDWRGAFWIEAVLIAACLGLWLLATPVPPVPRRGSIRDAFRCPNCWWAGVQHSGFAVATAAGAWISLYLLREFDLPLAAAGALGSLLLFVTTVTRPFGGWLVARHLLRTRQTMALGNTLIVVGVVLLALPDRPLAIALAGAVLLGTGGGLPYASVFNTAAASLRDAPGAGQGMPVILGNVVILTVTPAMGYAVQVWGFAAAWGLVAVLIGAVIATTPFMRGEEDLPSV